MIKLACLATIALAAWHSWALYQMGRALQPPNILVAVAIHPLALIAVSGGIWRAARYKAFATLALAAAAALAVVVMWKTGGPLLRRGTLDRVHALATTAELQAFAAPYCAAGFDEAKAKELQDRTRWPKWLTAIDPGSVRVEPICGGTNPTCFALHIQFGGGLLGHWGVAVLPGAPTAKPFLDELEPGLYWADAP